MVTVALVLAVCEANMTELTCHYLQTEYVVQATYNVLLNAGTSIAIAYDYVTTNTCIK